MFDELRQGVQDIASLTDPTVGEIRMGGSEHTISAIYSPVVHQLSRQYPRMSFHTIVGDLQTLSRELDARHIDFVVSRMYSPPSEEHSVEVLFEDPLVVVTGPNNPLARRRRSSLSSCWKNHGHCSRARTILARSPWMPFALPALRSHESRLRLRPVICAAKCLRPAATSQWSRAIGSCCRAGPHRSGSYLWNFPIRDSKLRSFSEESVAQSGHGAFHRQRAHPHEATGEGKITGSRATGGNRV